jgi:hypothetical protein
MNGNACASTTAVTTGFGSHAAQRLFFQLTVPS